MSLLKNTPTISQVSSPAVMPGFCMCLCLYESENDREGESCVFAFHMVAVFSPDGLRNSERWLKDPHVRKTYSFLSVMQEKKHRGE